MNSNDSNESISVEQWLADIWPGIVSKYGVPAKVFYSLARYLYQLQIQTENRVQIPPAWEYHIILGTEFCRELNCDGISYSEVLDQLGKQGHLQIDGSHCVTPLPQILIEADSIPQIEIELPNILWFGSHSLRLPKNLRRALATAYAIIEGHQLDDVHDRVTKLTNDFEWLLGAGIGLTLRAQNESENESSRLMLLKAENLLRAGTQIQSNSKIWSALSYCTYQKAMIEEQVEAKTQSATSAINAARKSIEHDSENDSAWIRLGVSLGILADHSSETETCRSYRLQEIEAYERAIELDQNDDSYWFNLGSAINQLTRLETDQNVVQQLKKKNVQAFQAAVDTNPGNHWAWLGLGSHYLDIANIEDNLQEKTFLLLKSISANHRALDVDSSLSKAWINLAAAYELLTSLSTDSQRIYALHQQQYQAALQATNHESGEPASWTSLGTAALQLSQLEPSEKKVEFRLQSIDAYRKALKLEQDNPLCWFLIAGAYREMANSPSDEIRKEFSQLQIEALKMTTQLEPTFVQGWLHLGNTFRSLSQSEDAQRTGFLESAIRAYQSAIDLEPDHSMALANLAWSHASIAQTKNEDFDSGRYRLAVEAYESAIRHDAENEFALVNLAIHFSELADSEVDVSNRESFAQKSLDLFRQALDVNQNSFSTWLNYCFCLSMVRESEIDLGMSHSELLESQVEAAEKATELDPQNENAWLMLGLSLGQSADIQKSLMDTAYLSQRAIEAFQSAVSIDERFFQAWSRLGIRQIYLWQIEKDEQLLEKAIESALRSIELGDGYYNAACVFAIAGKVEKAIEMLEVAFQKNLVPPEHAVADPDLSSLRELERFLELTDPKAS